MPVVRIEEDAEHREAPQQVTEHPVRVEHVRGAVRSGHRQTTAVVRPGHGADFVAGHGVASTQQASVVGRMHADLPDAGTEREPSAVRTDRGTPRVTGVVRQDSHELPAAALPAPPPHSLRSTEPKKSLPRR